MEQRCARWLLMCADRTEDDTFELAPEGLGEMLGAPLSTATFEQETATAGAPRKCAALYSLSLYD
jgi:hypothetical protein